MSLVPSEIVNMALGQLGSKMSVVNFATDTSNEASCARVYYCQAVREILEDFPWPFATVQQKLNLVEWFFSRERRFAYAYPANCIIVRRLFSPLGYNRNDDVQSRQKYKIIQTQNPANPTQQVKVILADLPDLHVEFTGDDEIVSNFSAGFKAALSFKLAAYMAPRLTGGDPYKLGDRALALYKQALATAETHAGNEQIDDDPRLGEFIDQRGPFGGPNSWSPWSPYPVGTDIENS